MAAVKPDEAFDSTWYDEKLILGKAGKLQAAREHIDRRLGTSEKWALGGTDEQVRQFTEHAKKIIQGATPCKRVPLATAIKIIESADGRFMSQFETGTSEGALNTKYRSSTEQAVLGFSSKNNVKDRPQYGYLSYADELTEPVVYARGYGEVIFELKPEAMKRATVTGANSLDYSGNVYGQPLKKPLDDNVMVGVPSNVPKKLDDLTRNMSPKEFFEQGRGYVEFQISGGLSMKDIQRVSFDEYDVKKQQRTKDIIKMLQDQGVEVIIRK